MSYLLSLFFLCLLVTKARTRVFCIALGSLLACSSFVIQAFSLQGMDLLHFYSLIGMACYFLNNLILRGWERLIITVLCFSNIVFNFTAATTNDLWLLINYNRISELFIVLIMVTLTWSERSIKRNIAMTIGSWIIYVTFPRYL